MGEWHYYIGIDDEGDCYVGSNADIVAAISGGYNVAPIADSTFENIDKYADMLEGQGRTLYLEQNGSFDHLGAQPGEPGGLPEDFVDCDYAIY